METDENNKVENNESNTPEVHTPEKDMILKHFSKTSAISENERFRVMTSTRVTNKEGAGLVVGVINYSEYAKVYSTATKATERAAELNRRYHD